MAEKMYPTEYCAKISRAPKTTISTWPSPRSPNRTAEPMIGMRKITETISPAKSE